jgi:hypothetical protein
MDGWMDGWGGREGVKEEESVAAMAYVGDECTRWSRSGPYL